MKQVILFLLMFLFSWGYAKEKENMISFYVVKEMEKLPGIDKNWERYDKKYDNHISIALHDWKEKFTLVPFSLSAKLVRNISKWAKKEMENYKKVPSLKNLKFKPTQVHKSRSSLLLEATIDTLPTHSHLVTRWLKLFLIYDIKRKCITKIYVTIRGECLE